ncbi:hypothetical protein ACOME3_003158 [Neoechinorhynchus agilis]
MSSGVKSSFDSSIELKKEEYEPKINSVKSMTKGDPWVLPKSQIKEGCYGTKLLIDSSIHQKQFEPQFAHHVIQSGKSQVTKMKPGHFMCRMVDTYVERGELKYECPPLGSEFCSRISPSKYVDLSTTNIQSNNKAVFDSDLKWDAASTLNHISDALDNLDVAVRSKNTTYTQLYSKRKDADDVGIAHVAEYRFDFGLSSKLEDRRALLLDWSPIISDHFIAIHTYPEFGNDHFSYVNLWSADNSTFPLRDVVCADSLTSVKFNRIDSNIFIGGTRLGSGLLFDIRKPDMNYEQTTKIKDIIPGPATAVDWFSSSNQYMFVLAYSNGVMRFWDARNLAEIVAATQLKDHSINTMLISPITDNITITGSLHGSLCFIEGTYADPSSIDLTRFSGLTGPVLNIDAHSTLPSLLLTSDCQNVKIFSSYYHSKDIHTTRIANEMSVGARWLQGPTSLFASAHTNGIVNIWSVDERRGNPAFSTIVGSNCTAMTVSPHGYNPIIVGNKEGALNLVQLSPNIQIEHNFENTHYFEAKALIRRRRQDNVDNLYSYIDNVLNEAKKKNPFQESTGSGESGADTHVDDYEKNNNYEREDHSDSEIIETSKSSMMKWSFSEEEINNINNEVDSVLENISQVQSESLIGKSSAVDTIYSGVNFEHFDRLYGETNSEDLSDILEILAKVKLTDIADDLESDDVN